MKTSKIVRAACLVAAIVLTFAEVQLVAHYGLPAASAQIVATAK
jgi:hypothetical protein